MELLLHALVTLGILSPRVDLNGMTFAVWLQNLDYRKAMALPYDILVVDYSEDGTEKKELTEEKVAMLKTRADGKKRLVLAYMSVGEAESYRFYFKKGLRFIVKSNPLWKGHFVVRPESPEWHDILYRGERSYLNRIISRGFDGVFLDTVDACEVLEDMGMEGACQKMAELVIDITKYAREKKPSFVVVVQNPFRIIEYPEVGRLVDGISIEAHLFPKGIPLPPKKMDEMIKKINTIRERYGISVFVIEYLSRKDRKQFSMFQKICCANRFSCYCGNLALDRIGPPIPSCKGVPEEKKDGKDRATKKP